jgi:hypothetical protein
MAFDKKNTNNRLSNASVTKDTISGKRLYWGRRLDGYLVYNNDTLHGLITLYKKEVWLEQPVNGDVSYFYTYKMKDKSLKTIVLYNEEKKPVCFTRIPEKANRFLRVVHEGKLNIYDGRFGFVYRPKDIDKYLLVVSYNGIVDDLSSFLTETTKSDLIMYINDTYGLHYDARKITWKQLLIEIDKLD